jgi:hypothetical protein
MSTCCILDMAQLRFQRGRGQIAVLAGTGEVITTCTDEDGLDDREAALRGMDTVLSGTVIHRYDADGAMVQAEVVLYNPYTFEIARGSLPNTSVYGDGRALLLPAAGGLGEICEDEIVIGARRLPHRVPEWSAVLRAQDAHLS